MFNERQLQRYAEVLWWGLITARTAPFKKNDIVLIRYNKPAFKLAEHLFAALLSNGIHPVQRMNPTEAMERHFYSLSSNKQLTFLAPGEKELFSNLNGSIFLYAPESLTHLKNIDPQKIAKATVAQKAFRDILNQREAHGRFSWTLCIFPTEELAKHAGLTMEEYTQQIIKACFLNKTEPVSHWRRVYKNAQTIKAKLNSMDVKFLHVESDNIDLEIVPGEKRRWIGITGRNIPSFEIFISPDWRRVRGKYYANQPSYRSGNYVKGIRLEFSRGRVVKVAANQGGKFAKKQLKMDSGADKVGEFSLTDKRFSKINRFMANTLFDENYGGKYGNCHIALGSSYSNTFAGDSRKLTPERKKQLGFNESALHWDLVNTEKKRVTAHLKSGRHVTIYENGRFIL